MNRCRLRCVLLSIALLRGGGGGGKADRRNVLCNTVASLDPFVSVCKPESSATASGAWETVKNFILIAAVVSNGRCRPASQNGDPGASHWNLLVDSHDSKSSFILGLSWTFI